MKVCIPTMGENGLNNFVGEHFGRVPTYTIVDLDTDDVKVIPNTSHHMGGQVDPPQIMVKEGVNVMLCQGLGRRQSPCSKNSVLKYILVHLERSRMLLMHLNRGDFRRQV